MYRFLVPLTILLAAVVPASAESPTNVVHKLIAAVRNADKSAVAALYAKLADRPTDVSWLDSLLSSDDGDLISPTWCPDSKMDGDAAVVVVATLKKRGPLDIDPCYLVRQNGKWLVLPKHTDIRVAQRSVSEVTMNSLESLKTWFTGREKQLYAELEAEAEQAKPPPRSAEEGRAVLAKVLSKRDPHGFPEPRRK